METIWRTSLAAAYRTAFDDLAIVLRGCPDELWEESLWEPQRSDPWAWPPTDPAGRPFDDPAVRERKFRATTSVWRTVSHALYFTDADLSGHAPDWAPPAPFSPEDEDGYVVPPTYSRDQLVGYLDHCRSKSDQVFATLTDEQAATVLESHRNGGTLADVLIAAVLHLNLHATQVRTFLRSRGLRCEDER